MKLYLSLGCVALLSVGISPSVAAEAAKEDLTASERSIAPALIEIHRASEELPQQEPAIATGLQPELPIQVKSLITSQKLETKQTAADDSRQPNAELTQNISNSDRYTQLGDRFQHRFSDNWTIRNAFKVELWDTANTFELPSYLLTDVAIFYRNNWQFALNIENLFDVDSYESARDRNAVFPGAPFTVQRTVSL